MADLHSEFQTYHGNVALTSAKKKRLNPDFQTEFLMN